MKSRLFYIFILLAGIALILFSLSAEKRSNAIIANVESQKTAISFRKPVQVKSIHVSPGQHVTKGQLLLEVERPDLVMDKTKLLNDREIEEGRQLALLSDYQSKITLLDLEIKGKIQRLDSDIRRLEAELKLQRSIQSDILAFAKGDSSDAKSDVDSPEQIRLASYQEEKAQLQQFALSEKNRYKISLDQDRQTSKLRLQLINEEESVLKEEESTLKQYAPFDGTIGNVNAQLLELIPPYQTIISVYEQLPSTITAYINLESNYNLKVGQMVSVESASRPYTSSGEIIEIGSRIVDYQDLSRSLSPLKLYGKEVFIKLPENNSFLYGEQVYVYIPNEE